jgi:hypothetical protein
MSDGSSSPFTFDVGQATFSALQFLQNSLTGARTAAIQVENYSSASLFYLSPTLYHGGFGILPAGQIDSGKVNLFGAQNMGGSIMTGTEGWVTYGFNWFTDPTVTMVAYFQIYWDNPYVGGNSANAALSGDQGGNFKARYGVGAGNAANFVFRFYEGPQIPGLQIAQIS